MSDFQEILNTGLHLHQKGQFQQAETIYRQVLQMCPKHVDALHLLGVLLHQNKYYSESESLLRQAIQLKPTEPVFLTHLGNLLREVGQVEEAIKVFKKVLRMKPDDRMAHLNMLVTLIASPEINGSEFFRYFRHWSKKSFSTQSLSAYHFSKKTEDKIHIGYVSPDFRKNSAAWIYRVIFEHHNRENFKVHAYAQVEFPDEMTNLFQQYSDKWLNTVELSDVELIDRIKHDQIDILVDMAGHTANNRLAVFNQKPAPILVTGFAGFTTGMDVFDYRLTDPYITPPSWSKLNSEKLFYLPHHIIHWKPPEIELLPGDAPFNKNGFFTFGSGHQLFKINSAVIRIWSQILVQVPEAKLHLKASPLDDAKVINRLRQAFEKQGVSFNQLIFTGHSSHHDHLLFYQDIDLVLETFPCSGGVTTCEALWMGVPYLTSQKGSRSRAAISILKAMDLPEFIAKDQTDFIQKAIQHARYPQGLLPKGVDLRQRFLSSPIASGELYIHDIETAYKMMWSQFLKHQI